MKLYGRGKPTQSSVKAPNKRKSALATQKELKASADSIRKVQTNSWNSIRNGQ